MKKKTKKNPNDATFRNIRALKKRVDVLEANLSWTSSDLDLAFMEIKTVCERLEKLEKPKRKGAAK